MTFVVFSSLNDSAHWHRMPKEAVDAPSLQAFEARLDVALGSLGCWLATLNIAGGWNLMSPFQPGPFSDSMTLLL